MKYVNIHIFSQLTCLSQTNCGWWRKTTYTFEFSVKSSIRIRYFSSCAKKKVKFCWPVLPITLLDRLQLWWSFSLFCRAQYMPVLFHLCFPKLGVLRSTFRGFSTYLPLKWKLVNIILMIISFSFLFSSTYGYIIDAGFYGVSHGKCNLVLDQCV